MHSAAEPVLFKASGSWTSFERRLGGAVRARTLFCLIYLVALWLDHQLHNPLGEPAVLKPSVGILIVALWLSRPVAWPAILGIHVVSAVLVGTLLHDAFSLSHTLLDVVPGGIAGPVGALACLALIRGPLRLHVRLVPRVIWGFAIGAAAGALAAVVIDYSFGAPSTQIPDRLPYHWGELILGALTTGPLVVLWSQARPDAHRELGLRSRRQLLAVVGGLVGSTLLVFWWADGLGGGTLLPLPVLVGPWLVYACFCLPPRWALAMVTLTNLLCAGLWALRPGPFAFADPLLRLGLFQVVLGIFAVIPFILSMVITQVRIALWNLGESEHRYRSFVQLSHEAVWRLEFDPPMPLDLPLEQQREWMHRHARVVESNLAYDKVAPVGVGATSPVPWGEVPWGAELEHRLAELAADDHSIEDVKFTVTHQGRAHSYFASFSAMLEAGRVLCLWGVARDVTELVNLNDRLQREQERLRSYARQVVAAEERARRATAVDLHDGIGQTLVGMLMMMEAAREQPQADLRLVLDELRMRLREVHETTRRVISDLSPPGLYDLGLGPALQWLAVQLRSQDGLRVNLECRVNEERISVETRVLVFKLVRELLRNVIKHAGVLAASVEVEDAGEALRVLVSDEGRGFEWQLDMFGARASGFGLWSIADRVREVGGTIHIDSGMGRGTRLEMLVPLRVQGETPRQLYA